MNRFSWGERAVVRYVGNPSFWTWVVSFVALLCRFVQIPSSLEIQLTIRQKNPHIVCQSGYVLDVNEYKDLFITPSAHITDRLNHSLAVKMTVAQ